VAEIYENCFLKILLLFACSKQPFLLLFNGHFNVTEEMRVSYFWRF